MQKGGRNTVLVNDDFQQQQHHAQGAEGGAVPPLLTQNTRSSSSQSLTDFYLGNSAVVLSSGRPSYSTSAYNAPSTFQSEYNKTSSSKQHNTYDYARKFGGASLGGETHEEQRDNENVSSSRRAPKTSLAMSSSSSSSTGMKVQDMGYENDRHINEIDGNDDFYTGQHYNNEYDDNYEYEDNYDQDRGVEAVAGSAGNMQAYLGQAYQGGYLDGDEEEFENEEKEDIFQGVDKDERGGGQYQQQQQQQQQNDQVSKSMTIFNTVQVNLHGMQPEGFIIELSVEDVYFFGQTGNLELVGVRVGDTLLGVDSTRVSWETHSQREITDLLHKACDKLELSRITEVQTGHFAGAAYDKVDVDDDIQSVIIDDDDDPYAILETRPPVKRQKVEPKKKAEKARASSASAAKSKTSQKKSGTTRKSSQRVVCQVEDCEKLARTGAVLCMSHGGGRRCQEEGCNKFDVGYGKCLSHGGGRRCMQPECDKSAVSASGLCKMHGGSKKCKIEGCTKFAQGSSNVCVTHGGGRRCRFEGCTKLDQGGGLLQDAWWRAALRYGPLHQVCAGL